MLTTNLLVSANNSTNDELGTISRNNTTSSLIVNPFGHVFAFFRILPRATAAAAAATIIRERRNSRKKRRKKCGWRSEREGGKVVRRSRVRIGILFSLTLTVVLPWKANCSITFATAVRHWCPKLSRKVRRRLRTMQQLLCCRRCYVHSVFTVEHNRNLTA
ncbi:hypothetical protein ALC53_07122 [Atta colombica]|uniref:Uncharacterized protein n=1 Tax=Atta colombica TaxID=520822 RepID=A0A195BDP5_9HYME|nr:hypothetical protein ALC53_07122 [Atta colombica]